MTAPTTIPTKKEEARGYRLFDQLLAMLNRELASSERLRDAIKKYNADTKAGRNPGANVMQSALLQAMTRGTAKAKKIAPELAAKTLNPVGVHNEMVWRHALGGKRSKAEQKRVTNARTETSDVRGEFAIRLLERTRVAAGKSLVERRGTLELYANDWAQDHYKNFQNNWNAAIRRAENTGEPVNLREIARKAIIAGEVPPNKKIRNRARLIARDQITKTATALDRARAAKLGAEFYQWRSVQDESVRPDHEAWNKHYFGKDGKEVDERGRPIPGGMDTHTEQPGDAVQCRCVAAWVILD